MWRQMVPDAAELKEDTGEADPLLEDEDSPVPSIVHRYPDRCLFLVSHSCASYCRFCTRKRKVGDPSKIHPRYIEDGLDYIRSHTELRDVVISGGDPLMLSDRRLEAIVKSVRAIPHIEIIRIGTRMPCVLPQRITEKLVAMLKKYHPLYMNVHFNHPDEITPESSRALNLLADAGIPLGNQTVLLKGVNDDPLVMRRLMQKLLAVRVRPYYIYQADYVSGTEHLRTTVEKGLEIMENLRGWTSGLAVPYYCIDAPGGGGKIPVLPKYLQSINRRAGRPAELRRRAIRLPAGEDQAEAQAPARDRPVLQLRRRSPHALKKGSNLKSRNIYLASGALENNLVSISSIARLRGSLEEISDRIFRYATPAAAGPMLKKAPISLSLRAVFLWAIYMVAFLTRRLSAPTWAMTSDRMRDIPGPSRSLRSSGISRQIGLVLFFLNVSRILSTKSSLPMIPIREALENAGSGRTLDDKRRYCS